MKAAFGLFRSEYRKPKIGHGTQSRQLASRLKERPLTDLPSSRVNGCDGRFAAAALISVLGRKLTLG